MATATLMLLIVMLVLPWQWHVNFAAAAASLAKPGCEEQCGGIKVPYPFGMGNSSCFHDEWFEIVCGDNSTSRTSVTATGAKPFLKKLNLEVLSIELATPARFGLIGFNNPIIKSSSNCSSDTNKLTAGASGVDFKGSTFYFSRRFNSFGGSGCDSQEGILNRAGKPYPDTACTPTCSAVTGAAECCQTGIPLSLNLFNVSFTGATDGCQYAFLASYEFFAYNSLDSCPSVILSLDYVPAYLEWGLNSLTQEAIAMQQLTNTKNSLVACDDYVYADNSDVQSCYCKEGFDGNPYLSNGCYDIDECLTKTANCSGICTNTLGNYTCEPIKPPTHPPVAIIASCSGVGVAVLILGILLHLKLAKERKKKHYFKVNGGEELENYRKEKGSKIKVYKVQELEKATNNFSRKKLLGHGGQGTVYKGTLSFGEVAIKKCNKIEPKTNDAADSGNWTFKLPRLCGQQEEVAELPEEKKLPEGEEEEEDNNAFINEVLLLSETIHTNIVRLLGCCLETEAPMLVYELVTNGNLRDHLDRGPSDHKYLLNWEHRLRIATEAAEGLNYLHTAAGTGTPIFHRDIKTANILLDNWRAAKIADFGISKSVGAHQTRVNAGLVGTDGYKDPEYIDSNQYNVKSDVYSFGVVLAELITGRNALFKEEYGNDEPVSLADRFKSMEEKMILSSFLDGALKDRRLENEIVRVIGLTKRCLSPTSEQRPTMKDVHNELQTILSSNRVSEDAVEIPNDYGKPESTAASPAPPTRPLRGGDAVSSSDSGHY